MSTRAFSLVDGGPLGRLLRRLGWVRPDGQCDYLRACLAVVAATWGPLFMLSMAERVVTGRVPSIDWGVHARLLVTIPLLFMAEASLHWRSWRAIGVFLDERWASDQADRVAKIIAFAEQLRDSAAPEVILLGLAVVGSQAVVWQAGGLRSWVSGVLLDPQQVAPKYWYALVSLPVFQFLLFRALWRWGIWVQLLWRLSRLRLRPIATHPDLAGGLGFLYPVTRVDAEGAKLTGANRYRLHFGAGDLPPVDAFWSVRRLQLGHASLLPQEGRDRRKLEPAAGGPRLTGEPAVPDAVTLRVAVDR